MSGTELHRPGCRKKNEMFRAELEELISLYASTSDLTSILAKLGIVLIEVSKELGLDPETVISLIEENLREHNKPILRLVE